MNENRGHTESSSGDLETPFAATISYWAMLCCSGTNSVFITIPVPTKSGAPQHPVPSCRYSPDPADTLKDWQSGSHNQQRESALFPVEEEAARR